MVALRGDDLQETVRAAGELPEGILDDTCSIGKLTLKVLVTTTDAQWKGMGDVGSARYKGEGFKLQ